MKEIVLAGGCFWGLQHFLDGFEGVIKTEVGYANGNCVNPDYRAVCQGSGHAEAVKVEYEDWITLPQILAAYFLTIDPTTKNRQGNDRGINYRTGIYTENEREAEIAKAMLADLQKHYESPIVVEVEPLKDFWPAEDMHQDYLKKNPGGYCHINPALFQYHLLPSLEEVIKHYPSLRSFYPEEQKN